MEFPGTSGNLITHVYIPDGDSQSPGYAGAGTQDRLHAPVCRCESTEPSCSWATRFLGGQPCFARSEGCFSRFPQTRL